MMGKKIIRLTESQMHKVIENTLSKVIKENNESMNSFPSESDGNMPIKQEVPINEGSPEIQAAVNWFSTLSPAEMTAAIAALGTGVAGFGAMLYKAYKNTMEDGGSSGGFNRR